MSRHVERRTVGPLLQLFRDFLRGKHVTEASRFRDALAARTQNPPTIPGGPNHKISKVYYFSRDAKRLVEPPVEIYGSHKKIKQIGSGEVKPTESKPRTPGKMLMLH